MDHFDNSRVLITGGTGSVGLVLAHALLSTKAKEICLFGNDENGLFEAKSMFGENPRLKYAFGDVRDVSSVESAIEDADIVFHGAALKHLNFCEENPYEAISTNVIGTQNVINSCKKFGARKFIYVSTDKAVNPSSTMGATKLLGEKLTIDAGTRARGGVLACVRFGNILGSRGSVLRIFERSVLAKKPLTVTNSEMTRFVMLPSEAHKVLLHAAGSAGQAEIVVLKMRALRIGDLAEVCRDYFAEKAGISPSQIKVNVVGSKPGEKMHEELMTFSESERATESGEFFVIPRDNSGKVGKKVARKSYSSDMTSLLSKEEILELLKELDSEAAGAPTAN
ncbi:MAG: polysaccharide biosynthesis protein [Thaumarchaeota archaeon]|nr:polysaccharide biosynthesis protein [Nitrososphaerota archaeon]